MTIKFSSMPESDQAYLLHKGFTLLEALPYIREHKGKIIVIKYGGNAMGNEELCINFAKDVGLIKEVGMFPIIVHGGGPQIGEALNKKNIKTEFAEGLRITDKETVKVVEDVLVNQINVDIVNKINETGGKAIGLAGNKDNLITAKKLLVINKKTDSNIERLLDIGFVGEPVDVNIDIIKNYLKKDYIPVISPLGCDKINSYNINADTVAGAIAGKIKSDKLLLLTNVSGIMDQNNKLIPDISLLEAKKLIDKDFIKDGMKPKIETCIKAIDTGVKETTILDGQIAHSVILELFTKVGMGTQIRK
tara:strand:- start:113 stop:1027 length:915 start_codon:yes stop_codon:yes gene_type:complete